LLLVVVFISIRYLIRITYLLTRASWVIRCTYCWGVCLYLRAMRFRTYLYAFIASRCSIIWFCVTLKWQ